MEIETNRLTLKAVTPEIVDIFSGNYELGDHISFYLSQLQNDPSMLGWGVWFVVDKESNTVIGDIGFKGKPNDHHTVDIGYGVHPTYQGKGIATEAVRGLIDWAFQQNVEIVTADCLQDNIPSIKVLEKIGMTKTKTHDDMFYWEIKKIPTT
ncbi:ribosomal-protein-alanine N-acetyltransferase [Salirhabdus euzebyi]|uniref:Ribosomal-protein-alanine N-acetyltransferase n=1 Tax=Salirhabdus euzebyi TaxID=394506 RepID=A0A841QA94_9BACI|nr:GNAT family N-acetyltransferase [Salirhabdus euzebyi]MBB6455348.1 ribosomal-protein-alanine N-acetyltransferase [Salirhabdus euzebyi]